MDSRRATPSLVALACALTLFGTFWVARADERAAFCSIATPAERFIETRAFGASVAARIIAEPCEGPSRIRVSYTTHSKSVERVFALGNLSARFGGAAQTGIALYRIGGLRYPIARISPTDHEARETFASDYFFAFDGRDLQEIASLQYSEHPIGAAGARLSHAPVLLFSYRVSTYGDFEERMVRWYAATLTTGKPVVFRLTQIYDWLGNPADHGAAAPQQSPPPAPTLPSCLQVFTTDDGPHVSQCTT